MKKIIAFILLTCMALTLVACAKKDPQEEKYAKAYALLEKRDYEAAYALFTELGDYKDAAKEAAYFRYIPTSHNVEYISGEEKEIITYTVTLNDQNLPATVVEEYNTGSKHTCTFTYNEFGSATRRECSDTEGVKTLYEATFDANGNCLTEAITDKDGNVSKFDSTYNEKGQLAKTVSTNAPDYYLSYTYTYDEEGREVKVICEDVSGNYVEETIYHADGKIAKNVWTEPNGVVSLSDYHYDEKGRLAEIIYTEDGKDAGFARSTFNDKDQVITKHTSYPQMDLEYMDSFEYDEHGNTIKSTYTSTGSESDSEIAISAFTLVYLPFDYTEEEWESILDSTQCWDWSHQ